MADTQFVEVLGELAGFLEFGDRLAMFLAQLAGQSPFDRAAADDVARDESVTPPTARTDTDRAIEIQGQTYALSADWWQVVFFGYFPVDRNVDDFSESDAALRPELGLPVKACLNGGRQSVFLGVIKPGSPGAFKADFFTRRRDLLDHQQHSLTCCSGFGVNFDAGTQGVFGTHLVHYKIIYPDAATPFSVIALSTVAGPRPVARRHAATPFSVIALSTEPALGFRHVQRKIRPHFGPSVAQTTLQQAAGQNEAAVVVAHHGGIEAKPAGIAAVDQPRRGQCEFNGDVVELFHAASS
ncbi:MAG: hypothetical protein L6Q40_09635 [Azonexus sp.]|nr:hypothetical protein [Azonexus sp.]